MGKNFWGILLFSWVFHGFDGDMGIVWLKIWPLNVAFTCPESHHVLSELFFHGLKGTVGETQLWQETRKSVGDLQDNVDVDIDVDDDDDDDDDEDEVDDGDGDDEEDGMRSQAVRFSFLHDWDQSSDDSSTDCLVGSSC